MYKTVYHTVYFGNSDFLMLNSILNIKMKSIVILNINKMRLNKSSLYYNQKFENFLKLKILLQLQIHHLVPWYTDFY